MSGSMAGSLISGVIADRFGRRLVLVASVVCHAICGFCLLLVDSFLALVAVRFLVALFGLAIFMTGCTLAMEIVGESKRSFAGMLLMYGWVIGMLFVSAVAYFARDWRVLQLILSSPTLLLISYYWILPESPRWLLDKQRYTEASKVLKKIAEVNKASEVDDKMLVALCEQSAEEGKTNVQEENFGLLLKSRTMVIRLAILCVNWCVCTMVYYGLTLNVGAIIEGDLYVNFFIMSVMELFAYALCTVTLDKLGRKKVYCTCLIVSGLSCLGTMIPILVDSSKWPNHHQSVPDLRHTSGIMVPYSFPFN
ncbi:organic cation transporter-like protein [Aplysia californica]|uniref:Organic cation transporter-like protein n=1 Tax=Aplysia californica TaxID=6500 RepID=A0ABM1A1N5_APLCA|nr:organic cation transporter-like protein [Aplysia californica]